MLVALLLLWGVAWFAGKHPHWPLIALLKDTDGLDCVRLGELDPRRLRHPESKRMVAFAQALFDRTDGVVATGEKYFQQVWDAAGHQRRRMGVLTCRRCAA